MSDLTVSTTTTIPAIRAEYTSPEIEAAKAAPDYADKMKRFDELAAAVLSGGKSTESERLQAYVSVMAMATSAQLRGMGAERAKVFDQIAFASDIGQKSQQLLRDMSAAVMPISMAGDGPGAARAALAFYDGLSASDQDILFQTSINAPMRDGKKFASVQGWRDNMNAAIQLGEYTQKNRDLIASGATSSPDDPKLEAALKLGAAADGSANWASMVLKLFERPKDKIDLSDSAKRVVGDFRDTPRQGSQYQEGSITSKTV